jgi:hypothetical protein
VYMRPLGFLLEAIIVFGQVASESKSMHRGQFNADYIDEVEKCVAGTAQQKLKQNWG